MIKETKEYIEHLKKWKNIFENRIKNIDKELKEIEEMEKGDKQ